MDSRASGRAVKPARTFARGAEYYEREPCRGTERTPPRVVSEVPLRNAEAGAVYKSVRRGGSGRRSTARLENPGIERDARPRSLRSRNPVCDERVGSAAVAEGLFESRVVRARAEISPTLSERTFLVAREFRAGCWRCKPRDCKALCSL